MQNDLHTFLTFCSQPLPVIQWLLKAELIVHIRKAEALFRVRFGHQDEVRTLT